MRYIFLRGGGGLGVGEVFKGDGVGMNNFPSKKSPKRGGVYTLEFSPEIK